MILLGFLIMMVIPITIFAGNWYYDNWCGGSLQYLDDHYCAKVFPQSYDRDWQCGADILNQPPLPSTGYYPETTFSELAVDVESLGAIITDPDVNICVIVTKRVSNSALHKSEPGVTLYNKYYCAGNASAEVAYETWSR